MRRGETFILGKHQRQWQNKSHYNFHTIYFSQNKTQPFLIPFADLQDKPQSDNSQSWRWSRHLWAEPPWHAPGAWGFRVPSLATSCPRDRGPHPALQHGPSSPQLSPARELPEQLPPACLMHRKSHASDFLLLLRQDIARMHTKAKNSGQTSLWTQAQLPKKILVTEMR